MKVEKISRRLFLKSSSIMALSALSFNSGMTVFADDSGDRENFRTEEYHKYDFDTGEESIEKIVFETNSLTDEETSAGYFPNGKIPNFDILDPSAIVGNNDIVVVDNPASSPYCSTVCLQITTSSGGTNYGSGFMIGPNALATAAHNLYSIKDDQIKRVARLRHQRDKLLTAAIRVTCVVIVHQRQIALRGQGTRGFVRDGDSILLHDFRQNRLLYRGGFALKGKNGSRHASAQCRRYQQRTQFLNLHLYRPPSQKLHPRQTAQPGSGWRLRTAAAEQQAVPA